MVYTIAAYKKGVPGPRNFYRFTRDSPTDSGVEVSWLAASHFLRGTKLWRSVLVAVEAARARKHLRETETAQGTGDGDA